MPSYNMSNISKSSSSPSSSPSSSTYESISYAPPIFWLDFILYYIYCSSSFGSDNISLRSFWSISLLHWLETSSSTCLDFSRVSRIGWCTESTTSDYYSIEILAISSSDIISLASLSYFFISSEIKEFIYGGVF